MITTKLQTDTWVVASWDEYIETSENPAYQKAKCYYHNKQMRIETMGVGPNHAKDHGIIFLAVSLFCIAKAIAVNGLDNCSYRKTGVREAQPDISYYVGDRSQLAPTGSTVVNLDQFPPPDLAIEIADTSLADDLGKKRLLYEELEVSEYWVVDVQNAQIIAFAIIANNGSRRITRSEILPGLPISLLEEALQRSREENQSQVGAWLLAQFQQL
jgi:Uma2 family endonuclease